MKINIIFIFLSIFSFSPNAYAYLDPGTGSIILQAIIGGLAACVTYIVLLWKKIKIKFENIIKKNNK